MDIDFDNLKGALEAMLKWPLWTQLSGAIISAGAGVFVANRTLKKQRSQKLQSDFEYFVELLMSYTTGISNMLFDITTMQKAEDIKSYMQDISNINKYPPIEDIGYRWETQFFHNKYALLRKLSKDINDQIRRIAECEAYNPIYVFRIVRVLYAINELIKSVYTNKTKKEPPYQETFKSYFRVMNDFEAKLIKEDKGMTNVY